MVLLVSLTSVDKGVAHLAAQALRYIAIAEMQADAPSNPGIAEEDRRQRHSVYIQLGDPNVIVFGIIFQLFVKIDNGDAQIVV